MFVSTIITPRTNNFELKRASNICKKARGCNGNRTFYFAFYLKGEGRVNKRKDATFKLKLKERDREMNV